MTKTAKVNGERIRALRSKRGLSQKELAGKVKVDPRNRLAVGAGRHRPGSA